MIFEIAYSSFCRCGLKCAESWKSVEHMCSENADKPNKVLVVPNYAHNHRNR